jgi:hypothetical protein
MTDSKTTIHGRVIRAGEPLSGAFVRVNGPSGDFVGEVQSSAAGAYRVYVAPGDWTVIALGPGGARTETRVTLAAGERRELDLELA